MRRNYLSRTAPGAYTLYGEFMKNTESGNFVRALETGDRELLRRVPRADVHNHAGLGGDFNTWVAQEGLDIKDNSHHFPDFTDFQKFVDKIYSYPNENPTSKQNRERILSLYRATYDLAVSDGVTLIEPGIDALILDFFDGSVEDMIAELTLLDSEYKGRLEIRPDVGMIRVFPMDEIERTIYPCIESGYFAALDVFADERHGPPEEFRQIYRDAKKAGMKLKAHAGELLDADFVRRSVEVLELDEVQHGIAAAKSPEVMRFLADNGIRLNICPSSNIQLCQVESFKTHPIRILMDNGVKVTVNTDDAIIFGQKSSDEFFNLFETGLYTAVELDMVRLNGFKD